MLNWIRPDDWGSFFYGFCSFPVVVLVLIVLVIGVIVWLTRGLPEGP